MAFNFCEVVDDSKINVEDGLKNRMGNYNIKNNLGYRRWCSSCWNVSKYYSNYSSVGWETYLVQLNSEYTH